MGEEKLHSTVSKQTQSVESSSESLAIGLGERMGRVSGLLEASVLVSERAPGICSQVTDLKSQNKVLEALIKLSEELRVMAVDKGNTTKK